MRSRIIEFLERFRCHRRILVPVFLVCVQTLVVVNTVEARHNRFIGTPRSSVPQPQPENDSKAHDEQDDHEQTSEPVSIDQPAPVDFDAMIESDLEKESESVAPDVAPTVVIEESEPAMNTESEARKSDPQESVSHEPVSHESESQEPDPQKSNFVDSTQDLKTEKLKEPPSPSVEAVAEKVEKAIKADIAEIDTNRTDQDSNGETSATDSEPSNQAQKNEPLAVTWYREKAELGDVEAQFNLAMISETGFGIEKDQHAAVKWYSKAASQGHAEAQLKLGMLYLLGLGAAESRIKGGKWVRSSARQDNRFARVLSEKFLSKNIEGLSVTEALTVVRQVYNTKTPIQAEETLLTLIARAEVSNKNRPTKDRFAGGVTGSGAKAGSVGNRVPDFLAEKQVEPVFEGNSLARIRRNAKEGIADAQYEWGMLLSKGEQVPRDKLQAAKWFKAAADQNHPAGLYKLAVANLYGIGVDVDLQHGNALLAQAAGRDHPVAKKLLQYMTPVSSTNKGAKRSKASSNSITVVWHLENALEQQNAESMLSLGYIFQNGWGVGQNRDEGSNWLAMAKSSGAVEASRQMRIEKVKAIESKAVKVSETASDFAQSMDRETTASIVENSITEGDGFRATSQSSLQAAGVSKDDNKKIARAFSRTVDQLKGRAKEMMSGDGEKQKPLLLLIGGLVLGFMVFRIMRRPSTRHSQSAYRF